MWKRILVLVLFLFGVFWWLTNRDQNPDTDTVDPDTSVETSVDEEGDDEDDENEDEDEKDEEVKTETPAKASTTTQVETTTETTEVTTPVVVAPKPAPVPAVTSEATVYLYEWGLDMNKKTFPAGTINFNVQNDGRFTHGFSVEGVGSLGKVTPSSTATFTVRLRPGQYEVFSDHRAEDYERGVRDMITVE